MERDNKQENGKAPVDELFARKLGNVSLSPSSDGFERLQARISQHQTKSRMVVWRNPNVHRLMAVAASLVLVCLFGWLYLSNNQEKGKDRAQVADKSTIAQDSPNDGALAPTQKQGSGLAKAGQQRDHAEHQTFGQESENLVAGVMKRKSRSINMTVQAGTQSSTSIDYDPQIQAATNEEVLVAKTKPVDSKVDNQIAQKAPVNETLETAERAANVQLPTTTGTERVLVVTIAEPERLVAARQVAKTAVNEPTTLVEADKAEKEVRQSGFWEQVRRVKQGEVFARRNVGDEERGLISRAYNGLKHSIDKEKDTK